MQNFDLKLIRFRSNNSDSILGPELQKMLPHIKVNTVDINDLNKKFCMSWNLNT